MLPTKESELGESHKALELTVPVQKLNGIPTKRITSTDCLDERFVREQLTPNIITEIRPGGRRWMLIVPYGGYSPNEHLMAMRWENDYTPGPERVSSKEGEELMSVMADIAQVMNEDPKNRFVVFGYNWSPRSFNQKGYQSMPTKFHPSIFGLPEPPHNGDKHPYMKFVDIMTLNQAERRAIMGGIYNEHFGNFLLEHVLNGHFQGDRAIVNSLFDMEKAQVNRQGVRIPLKIEDLDKTLRFPNLFQGGLQPIARAIDEATSDLSRTFTDLNPGEMDKIIEETVTQPDMSAEARQEILECLQRTPLLLEAEQRKRNIQGLKEMGYPPGFTSYLEAVNSRLPNSGKTTNWKVGFGYTLAFLCDKEAKEGHLAIFSAIADGPGGVVEGAVGAVLRRPEYPFSPKEMTTRIASYRQLVESIHNHNGLTAS